MHSPADNARPGKGILHNGVPGNARKVENCTCQTVENSLVHIVGTAMQIAQDAKHVCATGRMRQVNRRKQLAQTILHCRAAQSDRREGIREDKSTGKRFEDELTICDAEAKS